MYSLLVSLPSYRILRTGSLGDFSGPFGKFLKNAPVPVHCLPEEFIEKAKHSYLMQPISAYASFIMENQEPKNAIEQWPSELLAFFGRNMYEGMNCISAWKVIPYNSLVALIDTIKTRILNFSLEIEIQDPNAGEAPVNEPPLPQDKVTQVFNTYITGDVQNVATGGNHFKQNASIDSEESDKIFREILGVIMRAQANQKTIHELSSVVEEMRGNQGKDSFVRHYQSFTSLLADHITIFGPLLVPYLPLLSQMIK